MIYNIPSYSHEFKNLKEKPIKLLIEIVYKGGKCKLWWQGYFEFEILIYKHVASIGPKEKPEGKL